MEVKDKIKLGVEVFGCIALITIAIILFTSRKSNDAELLQQLIKSKDEVVKAKEQTIQMLQSSNDQKDQQISQYIKADSLLAIQSNKVTIRYEKIPVIVHALSNDSLGSAAENFR